MELRPASHYVKKLRPLLGDEAFEPARSRLLWLPFHIALIVGWIALIASDTVPWFLLPLISLAIGVSFAGITFVGHETAHGGTIRGRRLKHVISWFCFAPFCLAPRLWMNWHNRQHHGNTQHSRRDPDKYPILEVYNGSAIVRTITDVFSLGRRRLMGFSGLVIGFTIQGNKILADAHKRGWMTKGQHRAAIAESMLGWAMWIAIGFLIGPFAFVFAYVLPIVVANAMVMSYILTNHGLSPVTDTNDPLVNSLSVTVPAWYDYLTLGFGFHTEHHLFPAMSTRHAPKVRDLLVEHFPERYQSMPLTTAFWRLHSTARVYRDPVTLCHPPSGQTWSVLLPRERAEPSEHASHARRPSVVPSATATVTAPLPEPLVS